MVPLTSKQRIIARFANAYKGVSRVHIFRVNNDFYDSLNSTNRSACWWDNLTPVDLRLSAKLYAALLSGRVNKYLSDRINLSENSSAANRM